MSRRAIGEERPTRCGEDAWWSLRSRDKTVTVEVPNSAEPPPLRQGRQPERKFHAHDEANDAKLGDTVRIMETRPLSKQKRWRVAEIVERAR